MNGWLLGWLTALHYKKLPFNAAGFFFDGHHKKAYFIIPSSLGLFPCTFFHLVMNKTLGVILFI